MKDWRPEPDKGAKGAAIIRGLSNDGLIKGVAVDPVLP